MGIERENTPETSVLTVVGLDCCLGISQPHFSSGPFQGGRESGRGCLGSKPSAEDCCLKLYWDRLGPGTLDFCKRLKIITVCSWGKLWQQDTKWFKPNGHFWGARSESRVLHVILAQHHQGGGQTTWATPTLTPFKGWSQGTCYSFLPPCAAARGQHKVSPAGPLINSYWSDSPRTQAGHNTTGSAGNLLTLMDKRRTSKVGLISRFLYCVSFLFTLCMHEVSSVVSDSLRPHEP